MRQPASECFRIGSLGYRGATRSCAYRSSVHAQPAEHWSGCSRYEQFWFSAFASGESVRTGVSRSAVGRGCFVHSRKRGAVPHAQLQHPLRRLEDGARLIRRRMGAIRVALLFGSEKFGLSNEDLSHCHWLMRVPTREENISMNLGQAVAVCLYEIVRDAKAARLPEKLLRASAGEVERITLKLLEALHASGFLEMRRVADAEERIRRLVRRLNLPARDAVIWLGIMRQILWKMQSGKEVANEKNAEN